jgi:Ankyrin repeat
MLVVLAAVWTGEESVRRERSHRKSIAPPIFELELTSFPSPFLATDELISLSSFPDFQLARRHTYTYPQMAAAFGDCHS